MFVLNADLSPFYLQPYTGATYISIWYLYHNLMVVASP